MEQDRKPALLKARCRVRRRRHGRRKLMEINEFAQKICREVAKELGEEYRVELKEVRKNNGVMLHGLLISSCEGNVIPAIYLETFYAAYEDGVTFGEVLRRILEIYREETPRGNIDMEFFKSFSEVKDKICYRLIRRQDNEELLKEIPYVEFLDLAICFYYAYSSRILGEGTILIYNSHIELWGVKIQDLMRLAGENTPRLYPGRHSPMTEILEEIMETEDKVIPEGKLPLSVLTNVQRIYGAACILYPGVLERIAAGNKRSLYIIPSSVHEVILLEESEKAVPAEIRKMIYEVNRAHVAPEEILSDNLYFYDYSEKKVKIIF